MKNKLLLGISLFALCFAFSACSRTVDSPTGDVPVKEEAPKGSYKNTMQPFDQLVHAERIVILQNVFNPNAREGFYTSDTRPSAVEIEYNGVCAAAYPISHVVDFLQKGCAGKVIVTKTDGGKSEFSAADFRGMYAIIDWKSEAPPILYNPATKSVATDFAYAVTSEGEVIYSVAGNSDHNVNELLAKVGWKTGASYRFVATDKFHIPVGPDELVTGEIRGGLSGVINGTFPDLSIAHGKINDLLLIEPVAD